MHRGSKILIVLALFGGIGVEAYYAHPPQYVVEVGIDTRALAIPRWRPASYQAALQYRVGLFGYWQTRLAGWIGFADPAPRQVTHALPDQVPAEMAATPQPAVKPPPVDDRVADISAAITTTAKEAVTTPVIDLSRIVKGGASVFAGRSTPNTPVTLFEGDRPVAQTEAGSDGDWVMITEHEFASLEASISIREGAHMPPPAVAAGEARNPAAREVRSTADASPAEGLIKEFESAVAEARTEGAAEPQATLRDAEVGAATVTPEVQADKVLHQDPAPAVTVIPLPMQFLYNEATLTDDGRHATSLLLEYLKLKKFPSITLTGHADERGGPAYNLDLSRRRLVVIEEALRAGGYEGRITLMAKGEAEPFAGIDRSRLAADELMQLDRRVELRIAQ